jgi:hypothetical protein
VAILERHGGALRLGSRVSRVLVGVGGAEGVLLADGTSIRATRAVMSDTSAPSLLLDLVERQHVPGRVLKFMRRFPQGWGTFKLDWALSGPVPWAVPEARESAVVHVGDSIADLQRFTDQVRRGELPDNPYLVIGSRAWRTRRGRRPGSTRCGRTRACPRSPRAAGWRTRSNSRTASTRASRRWRRAFARGCCDAAWSRPWTSRR